MDFSRTKTEGGRIVTVPGEFKKKNAHEYKKSFSRLTRKIPHEHAKQFILKY